MGATHIAPRVLQLDAQAGTSTARTGWTCRRVTNGQICRHHNSNSRKRICEQCGKTRPAKKQPAHMQALTMSYQDYVTLNGGEHCGICGRTRDQLPNPARRLDRDHDHRSGEPRGLLCREDNRKLKAWITLEWVASVVEYLERRNET